MEIVSDFLHGFLYNKGQKSVQGIIVIAKSSHIEYMKENFAALDFDMQSNEIQKIEQLEIGRSLSGCWYNMEG